MAKKNKRNEGYLSIQKKLIAAVAMLLVASFMVASSSYAWFTLSTAPEVTGIKTNVGANGSLEIALWQGTDIDPTTNVGDSTEVWTVKNLTWGNQINLSDPSYGLDNIKLYPARLNANAAKLLQDSYLHTPVYGADGRVASLNANTIAATYVDGAFSGIGAYGVRAIGSSSTMTQQQTDLRNALSSLKTNLNTAKLRAQESLTATVGDTTTGSILANIMAAHATANGATEEYDITAMQVVLGKLSESQAALEGAIKQYYLAALAVAMKEDIDDAGKAEYAAAKSVLASATIAELKSGTLTVDGEDFTLPTAPAALTAYIAKYEAIAKAIGTQTEDDDTTDTGAWKNYAAVTNTAKATWTETYAVVKPLMIIDNITLNGIPIQQVTDPDNVTTLVSQMSQGYKLQLPSGSGVYADIAELAGELSASIELSISYNELKLNGLACQMVTTVSTETDPAPISTYDIVAIAPASNAADPTTESTEKTLTDFYGYIIDLAFRTNADASNLMLQTKPVDRIYSSGGVDETMGSGSSMTFTSSHASFTPDNMKALMSNIRIAFVSGTTVIAMGGLDTTSETCKVEGTTVTANIYLYDTFTFTADGTNGFKLEVGALQTSSTKTALKALAKNNTEQLSVLVYLDGDSVENGDVANAAESMSGSMNLQFSSDAELKPMDYSPLQGDGSGSDTSDDTFKAVTGITGVPTTGTAGTEVDLTTATVAPTDATNKTIVWSITDAGTTGVTEITDGKFTPTTAGTIKVTATIANGATESTPYTQEFTITIS